MFYEVGSKKPNALKGVTFSFDVFISMKSQLFNSGSQAYFHFDPKHL